MCSKPKKPKLPAVVEKKDSDNDGINDLEDKCPDLPGLSKYEGCPPPTGMVMGSSMKKTSAPNSRRTLMATRTRMVARKKKTPIQTTMAFLMRMTNALRTQKIEMGLKKQMAALIGTMTVMVFSMRMTTAQDRMGRLDRTFKKIGMATKIRTDAPIRTTMVTVFPMTETNVKTIKKTSTSSRTKTAVRSGIMIKTAYRMKKTAARLKKKS